MYWKTIVASSLVPGIRIVNVYSAIFESKEKYYHKDEITINKLMER